MTILDFKSNLLGGGARPNQFRVELSFPGLVSGTTNAAKKAQFLCKAASLPGSAINIANVFYRGREVKLAGERVFQNWQISVINDTDFAIRDSFERWMQVINNVKDNTGSTNPLSYTAQMAVHQLDRNGGVIKSYNFVDCWPTNLSEIALDWGSNDQVEEFSVEFAYAYWETVTKTSGVSAGISINTPVGGLGAGF
jgi:T4-like virus tail tube protein gp19